MIVSFLLKHLPISDITINLQTRYKLAVPMSATHLDEPQYRIVAAPHDSALFEHVRRIRIDVFVHEQGYPLEDEMDDYDQECFHLLLLHRPVDREKQSPNSTNPLIDGYEAAGTLRYFPPPKNKIGRVAVVKKFRGRGLGGIMMKGLEAMLTGEVQGAPAFESGKATDINMHAQGQSSSFPAAHLCGACTFSADQPAGYSVPVVPFYKGLGYETEGDEFL